MELRSSTTEDREKLERLFRGQLQEAEKKLRELRHKEKAFNKLERLQAQSEDMCRRLQSDIFSIKQQKVGHTTLTITKHAAPAPVRVRSQAPTIFQQEMHLPLVHV